MNYIKYILLGIIQGFTEPLPISSSGHIFLFKNIFRYELFNSFNFEIISNFGSFLAILFIFRKEVITLLKDFLKYLLFKNKKVQTKNNYLYVLKIIISTIPAGIVGLLLNDYIEKNYTSLKVLALSFLFTAVILLLVKNNNEKKNDNDITFIDAIIIGISQVITIIPGISRSGLVLVTSLLCKIKKESALKYTFMLYFPISIGTFIIKIPDFINIDNNLILPHFLGMISSTIITYLSYRWLSNIVKNNKLWKFSIYCVLLVIFIMYYFR